MDNLFFETLLYCFIGFYSAYIVGVLIVDRSRKTALNIAGALAVTCIYYVMSMVCLNLVNTDIHQAADRIEKDLLYTISIMIYAGVPILISVTFLYRRAFAKMAEDIQIGILGGILFGLTFSHIIAVNVCALTFGSHWLMLENLNNYKYLFVLTLTTLFVAIAWICKYDRESSAATAC